MERSADPGWPPAGLFAAHALRGAVHDALVALRLHGGAYPPKLAAPRHHTGRHGACEGLRVKQVGRSGDASRVSCKEWHIDRRSATTVDAPDRICGGVPEGFSMIQSFYRLSAEPADKLTHKKGARMPGSSALPIRDNFADVGNIPAQNTDN